jgi:4-hydroxyphenylpyruvate dioxygenase
VRDLDGEPCIDVLGDGTILHSLRDATSTKQNGVLNPRIPEWGVTAVDHVAYCLPWGTMDNVVMTYEHVFGLEQVHTQAAAPVGDVLSGMRSAVLRSRGFTVVFTEPLSSANVGQIQSFVQTHGGAGVQHIALACDDIVSLAAELRSTGVKFLPIREEDLRDAVLRLGDRKVPWELLLRHGVLVDSDDRGLLFQLFTEPVSNQGDFFFEFIQRDGAEGFGANNVRALYAAVDDALKRQTR